MSLTVKLDERAPGIHVVSPIGSLDIKFSTIFAKYFTHLCERQLLLHNHLIHLLLIDFFLVEIITLEKNWVDGRFWL